MWNPSLVRGQIQISVRGIAAWVQPFCNRHVTCSYTFTFFNFSSLCTEVSQHDLFGFVGLGVLDTLRGKRENKCADVLAFTLRKTYVTTAGTSWSSSSMSKSPMYLEKQTSAPITSLKPAALCLGILLFLMYRPMRAYVVC